MTDTIRINYAELGALAATSTQVVDDLEAVEKPRAVDLSHSPCVRHGYDNFESDWDKRRGELTDALKAINEALTVIAQVFEEGDQQMAEELRGGD